MAFLGVLNGQSGVFQSGSIGMTFFKVMTIGVAFIQLSLLRWSPKSMSEKNALVEFFFKKNRYLDINLNKKNNRANPNGRGGASVPNIGWNFSTTNFSAANN